MRCPACNAVIASEARKCRACGARLPRGRRGGPAEAVAEPTTTWIDSPNRMAVLAYRCCLLAMIPPLGLGLGAVALVLGLVGLRREKTSPSTRGAAQSVAAIVVGALTLLTNWAGLALILYGLRAA